MTRSLKPQASALDAFLAAKIEIDVALYQFCSGQVLMLGGPLFEGHG
jgi:hypothetical protein